MFGSTGLSHGAATGPSIIWSIHLAMEAEEFKWRARISILIHNLMYTCTYMLLKVVSIAHMCCGFVFSFSPSLHSFFSSFLFAPV